MLAKYARHGEKRDVLRKKLDPFLETRRYHIADVCRGKDPVFFLKHHAFPHKRATLSSTHIAPGQFFVIVIVIVK